MLLMTIATKSYALASIAAKRVAITGTAGVVALTKALIHRREILRLTELDERGLKDIGLVRSDVEGALAVSWLNDPSSVLASRSDASAGVAKARRNQSTQQAKAPAAALHTAAPAPGNTIACSA